MNYSKLNIFIKRTGYVYNTREILLPELLNNSKYKIISCRLDADIVINDTDYDLIKLIISALQFKNEKLYNFDMVKSLYESKDIENLSLVIPIIINYVNYKDINQILKILDYNSKNKITNLIKKNNILYNTIHTSYTHIIIKNADFYQ